MSSRLVVRLAIGLSLAGTTALHAQARPLATDSLLQRIRVLDSAMVARGRVVDSIRRSLVRPVPPVEVSRGALRVRTDSALEPRVRDALESVARSIDARGGTTFSSRAAAHVPTVTGDSVRSLLGMLPAIAINADTGRGWSMIGQRTLRSKSSVSEIADGLAAIVEQFAMVGADSALTAWVMLGRAPLRPLTDEQGADAYIELATTESIALRRCRARDVSACLDALGVDSMPGSRLTRWYAPDDYRAMVRVAAPPREDSAAVAAWIRCRERRDDAGCRIAASALPDTRIPLPLSAAVRFTFLREVLDAGGPGSFDRLLGSPGTIRDRLSLAAREPLDQTVQRWLTRVERSRPDRMRLAGDLVVASLGWTTVILALAFTRRGA